MIQFPPLCLPVAHPFPPMPASTAAPPSLQFLVELEARQDEVLRELDELNFRIEQAIAGSMLQVRRESKAA